MSLTNTFLLTILLTSLSQSIFASDSLYFVQKYARLNQNIDEDRYEQNIEDAKSLLGEPQFQALDCYHKGKILHKIGVSYYWLNQEEEAIRYFRDSVLSLWKNCPETPLAEKANTIFSIALSYQYLGNLKEGKQYLDDALATFENDPDYPPFELAVKYQHTGTFYLDNYNYFRAELYYKNALNIYRNLPKTEIRQFNVLNNLLIMSMDLKKYGEVKTYYQEALKLYRQYPGSISDLELSMIHQNAGIALWETRELEEAEQKSKLGLQFIDKAANPIRYSSFMELIALIKEGRGNFQEAIDALQEVIAIRLENLFNAASYTKLTTAYENMSGIYYRKGNFSLADDYINKAFDALIIEGIYEADGTPVVNRSQALDNIDLMRLLSLKSRIFKAGFQKDEDKTLLEKSLNLYFKIDTLVNQNILAFEFETSKLNFLESILGYYNSAIENATQLYNLTGSCQYLEAAYYFSSKTKAIILQNELKDSDAFRSVASPELIKQEEELVQKMYDLKEQMSKDEADSTNAPLLRQYIQAQRELETFISDIEQKEPDYYRQKYAFIKPPDIDYIQTSLPNNLAIVEYFYGADTIYSFWISRDDFFQFSIANAPDFEDAVQSYVDQCHRPEAALSADLGRLLYEKLLQSGLDRLDGEVSRLCIIPDGALHTLPFEALNPSGKDDKNFLIEDYSIFLSYSVGLLFRKKERSNNNKYLGFGSEYTVDLNSKLKEKKLLFGEDKLSRLILSDEEIKRASAIFAGETYLNQNASLENFYRYSDKAGIIHLSLHGLVDVDDPLRSSIVFDDREEDFILSAADLYSHKINADLVVLSACHSASGKIFKGEGVQGMSKAFMLSGAKNILSSLWSASEASSLQIMTGFLQNVHDGKPSDIALREAKLKYLETIPPSRRNPFYWANFILIGELEAENRATFPFVPLTAALSVFLLLGAYFLRRDRK